MNISITYDWLPPKRDPLTEEMLDAAKREVEKHVTSIWHVAWGDRLIGEKRIYAGQTSFLSKRFFRALSDADLLAWRPHPDLTWYARSTNVSHANREYRRRAAKAGFSNVYDWMRAQR